jgi:hypothetical protein
MAWTAESQTYGRVNDDDLRVQGGLQPGVVR